MSSIKKILIVEDDFQIANEWQNSLTALGYDVHSVSTADEGKLILDNNYQCFILDLFHVKNGEFLGNGGLRLIAHIRRLDEKTNTKSFIIGITGYYHPSRNGFSSTSETVDFLGGDCLLKKPLNLSTIVELIQQYDDKSISTE